MTARQDEARVYRVIEETLAEHGLNFTRYEGAHGGVPGLIVELPGERKLTTNTLLRLTSDAGPAACSHQRGRSRE